MGEALAGFRKSRWFPLVWVIPALLVAFVIVVLLANWLRGLPAIQSFMTDFPGRSALPESAPVGFPAWLAWQHFLNAFLILFVIRSGWMIRTTKRPAAYWTRNNAGLLRTKNPPERISLNHWFHISVDVLWLLNGIVFYILIFVTGQWMRIVPVSWDAFPNAVSAGIQYASLNWPLEMGWVNYNALQTLTYFLTVFIAAPLAAITGIRMAPGLALRFKRIEKVFPITLARAIHFPVMVYFVAFIVVHVFLVLTTGAINNLNHMYAVRNDESWWGFWIFVASIVVMAVAWVAARPSILSSIAALTGKVRR
ncbi:MAG TPA: cytochrome b/b6 domain-containing protein [Terrimesophilobacter sp.]|uniref:cytochrome b/b6 domain-containing protein n=1 Tax=Terrimesophilobacter sp. TaxID=2906435 RepID=UPI002F93DD0B